MRTPAIPFGARTDEWSPRMQFHTAEPECDAGARTCSDVSSCANAEQKQTRMQNEIRSCCADPWSRDGDGRTADPHLRTVSDHSSLRRLFDVARCNPAPLHVQGRLRLLAPWLMLAECTAHGRESAAGTSPEPATEKRHS